MIRFDVFVFDPTRAILEGPRGPRLLSNRAALLLTALLEAAPECLTHEQLLEAAWPEESVSGGVLYVAINELRDALGDNARNPHFIRTVPRSGYQWIYGNIIRDQEPVAADEPPEAAASWRWQVPAACVFFLAGWLLSDGQIYKPARFLVELPHSQFPLYATALADGVSKRLHGTYGRRVVPLHRVLAGKAQKRANLWVLESRLHQTAEGFRTTLILTGPSGESLSGALRAGNPHALADKIARWVIAGAEGQTPKESLYNEARNHLEQGRYQLAAAGFRACIREQEHHGDARVGHILSRMAMGEDVTDLLRGNLEWAQTVDDRTSRLHIYLIAARRAMENGNHELARQWLDQAAGIELP